MPDELILTTKRDRLPPKAKAFNSKQSTFWTFPVGKPRNNLRSVTLGPLRLQNGSKEAITVVAKTYRLNEPDKIGLLYATLQDETGHGYNPLNVHAAARNFLARLERQNPQEITLDLILRESETRIADEVMKAFEEQGALLRPDVRKQLRFNEKEAGVYKVRLDVMEGRYRVLQSQEALLR